MFKLSLVSCYLLFTHADSVAVASCCQGELERELDELREQLESEDCFGRTPPDGGCSGGQGGQLSPSPSRLLHTIDEEEDDLLRKEFSTRGGEDLRRTSPSRVLDTIQEEGLVAPEGCPQDTSLLEGLSIRLRNLEFTDDDLACLKRDSDWAQAHEATREKTAAKARSTVMDKSCLLKKIEHMTNESNTLKALVNHLEEQLMEKAEQTAADDETSCQGRTSAGEQRLLDEVARLEMERDTIQTQLIYKKDQFDNLLDGVHRVSRLMQVDADGTDVDALCQLVADKLEAQQTTLAPGAGEAEGVGGGKLSKGGGKGANKKLNKVIDSLKDEKVSLEKKISELNSENAACMNKLKENNSRITELEGQIKHCEAENLLKLSCSNEKQITLMNQVDGLAQELLVYKQDITELKNENSALTEAVECKKRDFEEARCELGKLNDMHANALEKLAETVQGNESYQERLEEMNNNCCSYKFEKENLEGIVSSLKLEVENMRVKTVSANNVEIELLKCSVSELLETQSILTKEKSEWITKERSLEQLQEELITLRETNARLQETCSETNKLASKLEELENLRRLNTENLQLHEDLERAHQQNLSVLKSKSDELELLQAQVQEVKTEHAVQMNEQLEVLRAQTEEQREALQAKAEEQREALQAQLEEQLEALQAQAAELTTQNATLQAQVEELTAQNASLQANADKRDKTTQNSEQLLQQMEAKHQQQAEQLAVLQQDHEKINDKLQNDLMEQSNQTAVLLTELDQKAHVLNSLQCDLTNKCDEISSLRDQLQSYSDQLSSSENSLAARVTQEQLWNSEREQLVATLTQKHQESVLYHTEIQRLNALMTQVITINFIAIC